MPDGVDSGSIDRSIGASSQVVGVAEVRRFSVRAYRSTSDEGLCRQVRARRFDTFPREFEKRAKLEAGDQQGRFYSQPIESSHVGHVLNSSSS